jgi:predicted alpha/beta superfamily hydrolase
VAISPSLWWDDRALVHAAAARLGAMPKRKAVLLPYSANEDNIAPETRQLADVLKAHAPKSLRWDYRPRLDLRHDNIYRGVEAEALRWALPMRK